MSVALLPPRFVFLPSPSLFHLTICPRSFFSSLILRPFSFATSIHTYFNSGATAIAILQASTQGSLSSGHSGTATRLIRAPLQQSSARLQRTPDDKSPPNSQPTRLYWLPALRANGAYLFDRASRDLDSTQLATQLLSTSSKYRIISSSSRRLQRPVNVNVNILCARRLTTQRNPLISQSRDCKPESTSPPRHLPRYGAQEQQRHSIPTVSRF